MGLLTSKDIDLSRSLNVKIWTEGTWRSAYPSVYADLVRHLRDNVVHNLEHFEEQLEYDKGLYNSRMSDGGKYVWYTTYPIHVVLRRSIIDCGLQAISPGHHMWHVHDGHIYDCDTCTFMFIANLGTMTQSPADCKTPIWSYNLFGDDLKIQIDICLQL